MDHCRRDVLCHHRTRPAAHHRISAVLCASRCRVERVSSRILVCRRASHLLSPSGRDRLRASASFFPLFFVSFPHSPICSEPFFFPSVRELSLLHAEHFRCRSQLRIPCCRARTTVKNPPSSTRRPAMAVCCGLLPSLSPLLLFPSF
ncbi:cobalt ABC transporter, inner membrane subunit CbiQ [Sesbania bispinosa]|nr:cobalt ABC transporter, inner membrane subunit CbiQ [Sesbania bispinosa]